MSWAQKVMAIGPELEQIAGQPVHLAEWDYGFSVTCGLNETGVKLASSSYLDPSDGQWYLMDGKVTEHLNEEQIKAIVTKRLTVAEAQELLRDFVRKATGKHH